MWEVEFAHQRRRRAVRHREPAVHGVVQIGVAAGGADRLRAMRRRAHVALSVATVCREAVAEPGLDNLRRHRFGKVAVRIVALEGGGSGPEPERLRNFHEGVVHGTGEREPQRHLVAAVRDDLRPVDAVIASATHAETICEKPRVGVPFAGVVDACRLYDEAPARSAARRLEDGAQVAVFKRVESVLLLETACVASFRRRELLKRKGVEPGRACKTQPRVENDLLDGAGRVEDSANALPAVRAWVGSVLW